MIEPFRISHRQLCPVKGPDKDIGIIQMRYIPQLIALRDLSPVRIKRPWLARSPRVLLRLAIICSFSCRCSLLSCMVNDVNTKIRADAAGTALAAAAVFRQCTGHRMMPFAQQEFLIDARRSDLPGQRFVEVTLAFIIEGHIDATGLEGFEPGIMLIEIRPAIEFGSILPGLIEHLAQAAVTTGKHALDHGQTGIMIIERNGAVRDVFLQQTLTAFELGNRQLTEPLERRIRFRHEAGHGNRHLDAAPPLDLRIEIDHLLRQSGDADDILVRLSRQPHHEVELDLLPALTESRAAGIHEVLLGNTLVDDIAQALGPGLRRKGQTGLADLLHLMRQLD